MDALVCSSPVIQDRALSSDAVAINRNWFNNIRARCCFASIILTILFFVVDLLLPRGATPAIGYCLVLVVAAGAHRPKFLLGLAAVCSVLTWVGYFLEPAGAVWWMSVFDRAMITMVVWIAFVLVNRRTKAIIALGHQTRILELTAKELERSNAELGDFASVIAHDLRAPLNTIGLFSQMMDDRRTTASVEERHESIDSIQNEINHMSGLIQRLLAYGRVGSGELRRETCDCEAVLNSVGQNLRSELQRISGRITHDPLPVVAADPTLIAELFQNLIENSLKYRGDAPPEIHVAAVENAAGYQFSVRDNGIGFQPADSQRIFEPFQQGNRTHGGVGLGLATCRRIVERHEGRIWAESRRPGQGATFHFTIPRDPIASTKRSEESSGVPSDSTPYYDCVRAGSKVR